MDFATARDAFCKLKDDLAPEDLADFFNWIQHTFLTSCCRGEGPAIAFTRLRDIANDIKTMVPLNAILDSETPITPAADQGSVEDDPRHCIHVDAFLYDESEIDDLVEENKLQRNYCLDCHSHNTAPLTFITHSISRQRLDFIFSGCIPYLDATKTLVDVGSRLGAVLYGAYFHSDAGKIVGIEINSDLCELQRKIVVKHKLGDRIEIVRNDFRREKDLMSRADVIVLNNVFEHFLPPEEQIECWRNLAATTKKGAILLTIPSLEESFGKLDSIGIDLAKWVKKRTTTDPLFAMSIRDDDILAEIVSYDVIGNH